MVALVRVTSPPSQSLGPYDNVREFEIVIFDMGAGTERVVAQEAYGRQPPLIVWNKDSVHLLVRWPTWSGL
jgi:hypothetical protein